MSDVATPPAALPPLATAPAAAGAQLSRPLGARDGVIALLLVAAVAVVYSGVVEHGFVNFDDGRYVAQNARVRAGLTWEGVRWALGSVVAGIWHPLTVLSLMADVEFFGVSAAAHKMVNVGLHAANAVLVFAFLRLATGSVWRSALAAALFALHPLRVESVAWVSERKDVLSTLLWLVALVGWVRYARSPSRARYALVAAAFALGMLAKPMLVTLPLTLLLVDVWPLGRIRPSEAFGAQGWRLVREKLPLLALSALGSVAAVAAQRAGGAISTDGPLSAGARLANAALSIASYLGKAVWPADLAVFYPHPALVGGIAAWKVAGALLAIAAITTLAVRLAPERPVLLFGWAWFLVTLVPVLGLVQVGTQGMADRYTYVPLLGPFVVVAWIAGDLARRTDAARLVAAALAVACTVALALATRAQVAVWRDSFTLFGHALSATGPENPLALRNLGMAHQDAGRPDLAFPLLSESVRIGPYDAHAWMNLGIASLSLGLADQGWACLAKAASLKPGDPYVWFNLGIAAAVQGRWEDVAVAEARLRELEPDLAARLAERARARRGY